MVQVFQAMKYIRGNVPGFEKATYDTAAIAGWEERIRAIIEKRQLLACDDWKAFGEELSGQTIEDFEVDKYFEEYDSAVNGEKDKTFLGKFFLGAMTHKGMIIQEISRSGNPIAGVAEER